MSGYGISTHGIIDEALRISRRRFLTKVAAAGLDRRTSLYDDSAGNAAIVHWRGKGVFFRRDTCQLCSEPPIREPPRGTSYG
jgi:hypothetical protein